MGTTGPRMSRTRMTPPVIQSIPPNPIPKGREIDEPANSSFLYLNILFSPHSSSDTRVIARRTFRKYGINSLSFLYATGW